MTDLSLLYCLTCISREHRVQEGKVVFPLGVSVQGDVVVSVYHMRSTIGGRLQAKVIFRQLSLTATVKFLKFLHDVVFLNKMGFFFYSQFVL